MQKTILCIATLDSKGPEIQYVRELIERRDGYNTLVMDISCLEDSAFPADISSADLAQAAGSTIAEVRQMDEAGPAADIISIGARRVIRDLHSEDEFHAVLAIGGGMGSEVASAAMRELPIGLPKLMLSSQKIVQAGIRRYVESKDILIFPSTADIAGLNRLTKDALSKSVGAVIGMLESADTEHTEKPLVFMTMTGLSTGCGLLVKSKLEEKGFEVVVFPAIGIGGETFEELVKTYPVKGVIELGLNEIGNELFGGLASAGPKRMEAAGEKGIPQIITPGCIDIINFLTPDTMPESYQNRLICYHNKQATLPRLNGEELSQVAETIARKLNLSTGRVTILIPLEGFSALDKPGKIFHDPEANQEFVDSLKRSVNECIEIKEISAHINDRAFAEAVVNEFLAIVEA